MKIISISGEIGWEVYPEDIRRQFDNAGGEEVELQISSPGGFVYDGIEIFNIVKNYTGKVTARIVGLAASMASYIAMSGDTVIAESNAVFMIHNASTYSRGDHRDLRHDADILEGFTNLLSKKYAEKSSKSPKKIRSLMDAESWFFGDEIQAAGFADETVNIEKSEDKTSAMTTAKANFKSFEANLKKWSELEDNHMDKIAALLPKNKTIPEPQKPSPSAKNTKSTKKEKMDLTKLKNDHPEVYAQAFAEGQTAENKRVSGHAIMAEKTGAHDFAMQCIKDSTKRVTDDDVCAEYQVAAMAKRDIDNSVDDNPPAVETPKEPVDSKEKGDEKVSDLVEKIMAKNADKKRSA